MTNELIAFDFENLPIRIVKLDAEPWFVLADVCAVLEIGNPSDVAARLDEDEKNTLYLNDGIRGNPNRTIVNEPGLYKVIFTSRKPEAKRFQKWVFHEVLPEIRKTGVYMPKGMSPEALEYVAQLALDNAATKRKAEEQRKLIQALEPDAGAFRVLNEASARAMDFIDTAKILKVTREAVFAMLTNKRWAYKSGDGRWRAYESAVRAGYMEVIETEDGKGCYDYAPLIAVKGRKKLAQYLSMISVKRAERFRPCYATASEPVEVRKSAHCWSAARLSSSNRRSGAW